jgi:hypothetical protein
VTPLIPLTLAVLRRWEAELLEVERRCYATPRARPRMALVGGQL